MVAILRIVRTGPLPQPSRPTRKGCLYISFRISLIQGFQASHFTKRWLRQHLSDGNPRILQQELVAVAREGLSFVTLRGRRACAISYLTSRCMRRSECDMTAAGLLYKRNDGGTHFLNNLFL